MGRNRAIGVAAAGTVASIILAACTMSLSQSSLPGATSLALQRELLPDQQVRQVLDRFAFGGRPGDAERVRAMGVDRWIALQLHPERIDDHAADRVVAGYSMLHVPTSEMLKSYRELREARRRGMLAPVHAVGSPSSTRSHFDAQQYMESGTPDRKGTVGGWLNRYLATKGTCEECSARERPSTFRAVSMTPQTPLILEGPAPSIAMNDLNDFTIRSSGSQVEEIEALYYTGASDIVHAAGSEMVEAMRVLRAASPSRYRSENGAEYPRSPFGRHLQQIAQLIKADVGLEIAFADVGGWDTHVNQGGSSGQLALRLADFARSIGALVTDLGDRMADVTIMTMSEFGRTARQNGNGGTDHGHASALFVIGGSVKGGKVHGRWPGLAPDQLNEGRDLALTTDFRSVFSEVITRHLGAERIDAIFPGYGGGREEWLGVV